MIPIRGLRPSVRPETPTVNAHITYRPPHSIWSDDRERRLIELWDTGLPIKRIAERLSVSTGAVSGKAQRMGLPRRGSPVGERA